jgi:hypothetical protein
MNKNFPQQLLLAAVVCVSFFSAAHAQGPVSATQASFDNAINQKSNWYASWGYSRQQYDPTDIRVSQPSLGNDFTVHNVKAGDYPTSLRGTIVSLLTLNVTSPQENVRVGKFFNPEKSFAVEFSLDHSKYNTNIGQSAKVTGTKNGAPFNENVVLSEDAFKYNLHNGLNHVMMNAVWFHHLSGPQKQPGELQLISRAGAGILLPHADNVIDGRKNEVGPKTKNICCSKGDWWQLNGWTAGVEVGARYLVTESIYIELTGKRAYGELRGVPVYQGKADQKIWMTEQVLSAGFLF